MRKLIHFLLLSAILSVMYVPGYCTDDHIAREGFHLSTNGAANPDTPPGKTNTKAAVFDLALMMTLSAGQPEYVAPGELVSFDITVFNQGAEDAFDIMVTDYIPMGFYFDPSLNPAWFDMDGDWNPEYVIPGPLSPGQSVIMPITLIVNSPFTGLPEDLVNYVEIVMANDGLGAPGADIDSYYDNDPSNDPGGTPNGPEDDYVDGDGTGAPLDGVAMTDEDDHDPAKVSIFDLALSMNLSAGQAQDVPPGADVAFDIMVYNQGSTDAYEILINDYVPAGYTFNPALNLSWSMDSDGDSNPDIFIPGPIPSSASYTETIILTVIDPFTGTPNDLVNYAEISYADDDTDPFNLSPMDYDSNLDNDPFNDAGGTPDGPDDDYVDGDGSGTPLDGVAMTDEDDHDPAYVNILSPAVFDLALMMTLSPGQAQDVPPGADVSFEITVVNQGTTDAYDVGVVSYVPAGYTFNPALNVNWNAFSGDPATSIGLIPLGTSYTETIILTVNDPFTGTPSDLINYAEIVYGDNDMSIGNGYMPDADSTPDWDPTNDAGGTPDGPEDDYVDGDGSGTPLDGVAMTDEDDHDPAYVNVITPVAPCMEDDYQALKALYLSTNGDAWVNNSGWPNNATFFANPNVPSSTNFSTWHGITTDVNGCVTHIELPANNVDGFIPTAIELLSSVLVIDLSYNNLVAGIPTEMGNLSTLMELTLSNNVLAGSIPASLANLTNLTVLDIQYNAMVGCYDPALLSLCGQITHQADWIHDGNNFDALWNHFCAFGNCTPVVMPFDLALTTTLSAGQSATVAPGETVYFDITVHNQGAADAHNIVVLNHMPTGLLFYTTIGDNYLWFNDPALGGLIETVITGPIAPGDSEVISIALVANPWLSGTTNLVNAAEIGSADDDTDGSNAFPLDIDSTPDWDPANDAGGAPDSPADDSIVGDGTGMPGDADPMTDEDDHDPATLTVSPVASCVDRDYQALRQLYIDTDGDNWTNSTGWPTAADFATDLTAPSGTDLSTWQGIVTNADGCVTQIWMASNNLVGTLPSDMGDMVDLTDIFMGSNQLSGSIPSEFGNLTNVNDLLLNFNQLSGSIPSEINDMSALVNLRLEYNQLSGDIPYIGNLTNLNELSLSSNQLTGEIPSELGTLPSFNSLKISNNQLSGCYSAALLPLCSQLSAITNNNANISYGNMFDSDWEDFCAIGAGTCMSYCAGGDDLGYLGGNPITNGVYHYSISINSTGTVPNGGDVQFRADDIITLEPGFTVEPQADFSAEIKACQY